jgi:hypothetical protein
MDGRLHYAVSASRGITEYLKRVGTATSILFNAICGGEYNQSFSARNYHWYLNGKPNLVKIIDTIFGRGHCYESMVYFAHIREAQQRCKEKLIKCQ